MLACIGRVDAYYDDNSRYDLERSRVALLDKRDRLAKEYDYLLRESDDLNKRIYYAQQRARVVSGDMKQTDDTLRDVEYSLRHIPN